MCSRCLPLVTVVICALLFSPAASASNRAGPAAGYIGSLSAERTTDMAVSLHTFSLRVVERNAVNPRLIAAFSLAMRDAGHSEEVGAPVELQLVWGGDFEGGRKKGAKLDIDGRLGSHSATELGLNINIPITRSAAQKYGLEFTLGCRLLDEDGEVWKGKATMLTNVNQPDWAAKTLARHLIKAIGRNIDNQKF